MTQKYTILRILKRLLSENQITYSQLAKQMRISEVSIKRMLNGKTSLDVDRMEVILKIIGIDFLNFAEQLTLESELNLKQLSENQEKSLAKNEKLLAFFYLVLRGHSFEQIAKRYSFSEKEVLTYALKLEKEKILELHPKNRIKLLVSRYVQWRENGPLEQKFRSKNQNQFLNSRFKDPNTIFRFATILLPEKSIANFIEQFNRLIEEMRETSTMREVRDPKLNRPFTLFIAGREYIPEFINQFLRTE